MANQYKNKVVYGGDTLIDLTEDTVTTDTLLSGTTAHDKSGAPIRGTYTAPVTSVNGQTGDVTLTATEIGLGNVDNTADLDKPVSTATATAIGSVIPYIIGTQTAATNAWTGVAPFATLQTGQAIIYHLPVAGTSTAATLNLTLSDGVTKTGAIQILRLASTTVTTTFAAGCDIFMVYNGSNWKVSAYYDSNSNTVGYQLRTNSSSLPMNSITYRYRLLFQSADNTHWVPANNSTSTNATAKRDTIQTPINPFGEMVYYGTTASVSAGSNPSASYLWQQYNLALGYSFNRTGSELVLTYPAPVYLKCAPQSDGSAIIEAETPYVQSLPSTADGKIYIYLGRAYSATQIELVAYHPIYCYRNDGIELWTGMQKEIDDLSASIPTATSDLTNDSGFITDAGVTSFNGNTGAVTYTAPVTSVNGSTGAVVIPTITVDDALSSTSENPVQNKVIKSALDEKGTYSKPSGGIPASDLANGVIPSVPSAYSSNPAMNGTASPGSSASWARGDHVHPSDTNKQNSITASGILKGNGNGSVSAAVAGTDYAAPDLGITGSSVGDAVIVKTVDTNGVPTSFESGEISGGADTMVINVTYNNQSYKYEADKTFAEIYAAYQNGSLVYMVNSSGSIFDLYSVSASSISFCYIAVYSSYVSRSMYSISSSNTVTFSSATMNKPSLPSPLYTNPIILVRYDDSQDPAKYVVYNSDINYMYEVFYESSYGDPATTGQIVTLQYSNSGLSQWDIPPTNAEIEEYKLVDAYTTYVSNSDDPYAYDNTFYGHLVFSKVGIVNGQVKLKTFTVEAEFNSYLSTNATVTYSETSLGQAPSATGVSF